MISILVTFYDNRRMLRVCLDRLLPTLSGHDAEVVVVDDNPERPLVIPDEFADLVRVVRSPSNLGYSGACNLGVDSARGEQILFLDCDIVVTDGWLTAMLHSLQQYPDAGAVSAKILDLSTGRIAHFGAAVHEVDSIHPYQDNDADFSLSCEDRQFRIMVSGALLMDRQFFRTLGGFDFDLRNAFGDFELALKMAEAGRPARISARSIVYHRGVVSGAARYAHYADAKALFFKRWGTRVGSEGLTFLTEAAFLLRGRTSAIPHIAVNLSSSIFSSDYIRAAVDGAGLRLLQTYNPRSLDKNMPHIRLEDRLDWELCRLNVPLLYFVDRYRAVADNHYWFEHRMNRDDLVADRNGNIAPVSAIRTT
ncbi:MAG TPA: glycosyltransferase [Thermoanaerobaculia bacterium]|nr:glycosyltransferase [Thermoanaerobaculia bacterium]